MKSRNLAIIRADSFSKYRAELMGLATLLVLLVHSFECRISYRPDILNLIFKQSFIGVDIFLLISGVGVYWSLAKNESATDFWMRRIGKILPIYLPIISAFAVWKLAVSGGGITAYLSYVSTLSVWTDNSGAWYVALLVPIYFIAPFVYKLYGRIKNSTLLTALLSLSVFFICVCLELYFGGSYAVQIKHAARSISFIIGLQLGKYAKEDKKLKVYILVPMFLLIRVGVDRLTRFHYTEFAMMMSIALIIIAVFENSDGNRFFQSTCKALRQLGKISLESYLFNCIILELLKHYEIMKAADGTNADAPIYAFSVIAGTALAWCYHNYVLPQLKRITGGTAA